MPEEEGEVRRAVAPAAELEVHGHEGSVLERHEEVLEVEVAVREDDLAADARRRLARVQILPAREERRVGGLCARMRSSSCRTYAEWRDGAGRRRSVEKNHWHWISHGIFFGGGMSKTRNSRSDSGHISEDRTRTKKIRAFSCGRLNI